MVNGETVFVDHVSYLIKVCNQVSLGSSDPVRSKDIFEYEAQEHGITIKSYRVDNFIFTTNTFTKVMMNRHQKISLSDVGAHGQNGFNERVIQTAIN